MAQALFAALTSGAGWTAYVSTLALDTAFASVTLRSVHSANQAMVASTGSAVPGSGAGQALPNEVAIGVTLRTALTGIANRGRIFLPGHVSAVLSAGNVINAGTVTGTNTWVAGFPAIFSGQGMTLVLGQRDRAAYIGSTGTSHPARLATSQPVTQLIVRDNHWDSQRRRGLK
jgi:hypothetical protein